MQEIENYTEVEWARIQLKMEHEGGLRGFMDYGLPHRLYLMYEPELTKVYKFFDNDKWTKKQIQLFNTLESKIESNFTDKEYNDDELNACNYIFDER